MTRNVLKSGLFAAGLTGLATALGACAMEQETYDRGYVVDDAALAQVKVNATNKTQALAIMGTPSTTSTVGGDAWYYIGQKISHPIQFLQPKIIDQTVLALYFDKSGRVSRIANYGLKDGQVFDFVSRTTPTGGQEPDYLRNIFENFLRFG